MLQRLSDHVGSSVDTKIGLIHEGDIFYLVLNRQNNTFDKDSIDTISKYLDVVAEAKGARVLVTLGTGPKFFSTGFPLD